MFLLQEPVGLSTGGVFHVKEGKGAPSSYGRSARYGCAWFCMLLGSACEPVAEVLSQ